MKQNYTRMELYHEQCVRLPKAGKQVIAARNGEDIIVYQAFNKDIVEYAANNGHFGGPHYSFTRMSWIKPGFLWMMYRSGWASKHNQERILAISLPLVHFKTILANSTFTSIQESDRQVRNLWKEQLEKTEVRLQWDPDHDPFGNKQERKAIQLGMKGDLLHLFATEWITGIEDITGFVREQYLAVERKETGKLLVPYEEVINLEDAGIEEKTGIIK